MVKHGSSSKVSRLSVIKETCRAKAKIVYNAQKSTAELAS